jgi:hypothetical protein
MKDCEAENKPHSPVAIGVNGKKLFIISMALCDKKFLIKKNCGKFLLSGKGFIKV